MKAIRNKLRKINIICSTNYDQRPYRADESMIRPTDNNHSALGHRSSNGMSPLTNGNGAVPRKKESVANGRSVAFDSR